MDRPESGDIATLYDRLFREGEYEQHRAEYEAIKAGKRVRSFYRSYLLNRIERSCRKGNMIEIGGGTGAFGVLAKSRGWQYLNYDISNVAVDYARELGLKAFVFDVQKIPPLPPRSANAVVMWEVIEHVWNVHGYLAAILESLKPNGALILSTPNFDFQSEFEKTRPALCTPPVHINFFTEHSLKLTLEHAGFINVQIIKRRLYRPSINIKSIIMSLKWFFALYPPQTLYAIARI
jgi:2-polyprenyl-3-methyl-5-hydroxy-6-metoxy-1,4-benzoquinol methylase